MDIPFQWERGHVLDVPVLTNCPFSFELEVDKVIPTNEEEGDTVFLCRIRNVLKDASLVDSGLPVDELMRKIGAVRTAGGIEYWLGTAATWAPGTSPRSRSSLAWRSARLHRCNNNDKKARAIASAGVQLQYRARSSCGRSSIRRSTS